MPTRKCGHGIRKWWDVRLGFASKLALIVCVPCHKRSFQTMDALLKVSKFKTTQTSIVMVFIVPTLYIYNYLGLVQRCCGAKNKFKKVLRHTNNILSFSYAMLNMGEKKRSCMPPSHPQSLNPILKWCPHVRKHNNIKLRTICFL